MERKKGYGIVYNDVCLSKIISLPALGMYAYLSCRTGTKESCWPSLPKICEDLGISKPSALKYLRELEAASVVEVSRSQGVGNVYKLIDAKTFECETSKNSLPVPVKNLYGGSKNSLPPPVKIFYPNKNKYNKTNTNNSKAQLTHEKGEIPKYVEANRAAVKPFHEELKNRISFRHLPTTKEMQSELKTTLINAVVPLIKDDPRVQRLGKSGANGLLAWFVESKFDGEWKDKHALARHVLNSIKFYQQAPL